MLFSRFLISTWYHKIVNYDVSTVERIHLHVVNFFMLWLLIILIDENMSHRAEVGEPIISRALIVLFSF